MANPWAPNAKKDPFKYAPVATPTPTPAPAGTGAGMAASFVDAAASAQGKSTGHSGPQTVSAANNPYGVPDSNARGNTAPGAGKAAQNAWVNSWQQQNAMNKPTGQNYEGDASSMWASMMADHEAGLEGKLQGTYADEALSGRRMAEMNALGGGGVGGAFAGGAGQVALGGMQQRLKTRNDHTKQGLEMKMARLTQLIKQAEAGKDRNLQRELQAEMDKTQMAIAGMHAGSDLPPGSSSSSSGDRASGGASGTDFSEEQKETIRNLPDGPMYDDIKKRAGV